jgi:exosortase
MKSRIYHVLLAGPVVLAWIWTWRYLALEWSANEQYQFGFAVPVLGIYLGYQRWPDRLPRGQQIGFILYLTALPILFMAELLRLTDPLWRLTGAVWMVSATLLTIGYLSRLGGWILVRRMIFPLGFLWLGLPWPMPLKNLVVQAFSLKITAITTTLLNLWGIAAFQRGNVIEITGQLVGVDAACSGIQSLQASLMASSFLWGSFKLPLRRGLALLITGAFLSSALNLGRVIVLTYCAQQFGTQNQTLHDWVGGIATLLILGGIFLVAVRLRASCKAPATESERAIQFLNEPFINRSLDSSISLAPQAIVFAAFLMIPLLANVILGPDTEGESAIRPRWKVDLDNLPAGWSVRAFSPTPSQAEMLRYTDWAGFHVRTSDGLWADIVHLFWRTRQGMPSLAFYHTPALCLPSTGWQMIGEPEAIELHGDRDRVSFVRYLMQQANERIFALQFVSRGKRIDPFFLASIAGKGRLSRFARLWRGSRDPVNEEILIYLPEPGFGDSDMGFATELFSKLFKPVGL